jgi:transcriptional activator of cad operon
MDHPSTAPIRIGAWDVDPAAGHISRDGEIVRIEARTMRLLLHLAQHAGDVVSIDELLKEVWSGVIVTSDSVYQAITSLRRVLGDDAKQPSYIATVPRRGYRLVATVSASVGRPVVAAAPLSPTDTSLPSVGGPTSPLHRQRQALLAVGLVLSLALVGAFALRGQFSATGRAYAPVRPLTASKSIAVVPFIDLTAGMSHEYFADGMTEEVIDKLSKVPGLRVAAPTSSFYLKGKQIAIADIAKGLGVAYVLDGSVRKSRTTLRVAARLSRADNGYVVWSETYDRPVGDMLMIQDDIASAVAKALRTSIDSG